MSTIRTRLFTLLAAASVISIPVSAAAESPPPIEDAIAAARAQGKALVVEFEASWCGPCKEFKAKVLPLPAVQKALRDVHFVQYDAEVGVGLPAAKRYNVNGYPTFLVINSKGDEVLRDMGGPSEQAFLAFLTRADLEVLDEAALGKRIANNPDDPKLLLSAARWYRARGNASAALDMYRRAGARDRGNRAGIAAAASWERMELRRYHKVRKDMVREWTMFIRRYPTAPAALHALQVVAASGTLSTERLEGLGNLVVDGIGDNASMLNSAVYALLGAGAPKAALRAAERQVALDPTLANPYDSLAEALHYNGRQADAVAASKKGVSLASKAMKPIFLANLARFEKPGQAPVYDVDIARHRAGQVLRGLPGEDPAAQKSEPRPVAAPSARALERKQQAAFTNALRTAAREAGKTCATHARKLDEIYVRVELTAKARKADKVVVLEPGAPRKLVRCLKNELRDAKLPAVPSGVERQTMPIKLAKASKQLTKK